MTSTHVRRPSDVPSEQSNADSVSAQDYITQQLQLEADAREALPFQFDTCSKPLGPLRQSLFSCLTCNPPTAEPYVPAGICYSCSISCHGEHELVELFSKRDFECDCGTTRMPDNSPCTLRPNPRTGLKGGVTKAVARSGNRYNHNFAGRFCGCGETYDPGKEKGTMFQCLGLGHLDTGGCGEDWWHPECLLGLQRTARETGKSEQSEVADSRLTENGAATNMETHRGEHDNSDDAPLPSGFPDEDQFDHLICYKCTRGNAWLKPYAGCEGFLSPVYNQRHTAADEHSNHGTVPRTDNLSLEKVGAKRKLDESHIGSDAKKPRTEPEPPITSLTDSAVDTPHTAVQIAKHTELPPAPLGEFSIFVKEDFRDHLCHCADCFPRLRQHPQLLEVEDTYEPPMSDSDEEDGHGSVGSRSLLDRGEAALSTMDRMRAIEGVMAYNHLRDKVKAFLQPFAESGQAVGAEDVKAYFARLRGDEDALRAAGGGTDGDEGGDSRREQSGY